VIGTGTRSVNAVDSAAATGLCPTDEHTTAPARGRGDRTATVHSQRRPVSAHHRDISIGDHGRPRLDNGDRRMEDPDKPGHRVAGSAGTAPWTSIRAALALVALFRLNNDLITQPILSRSTVGGGLTAGGIQVDGINSGTIIRRDLDATLGAPRRRARGECGTRRGTPRCWRPIRTALRGCPGR
jgi:hypothetical protein